MLAKTYGKKANGCMLHNPIMKLVEKPFTVRFVNNITKPHNSTCFAIPAEELMSQITHDITCHDN
eukprot:14338612-Ditylum_brightwellii.AAC.1